MTNRGIWIVDGKRDCSLHDARPRYVMSTHLTAWVKTVCQRISMAAVPTVFVGCRHCGLAAGAEP